MIHTVERSLELPNGWGMEHSSKRLQEIGAPLRWRKVSFHPTETHSVLILRKGTQGAARLRELLLFNWWFPLEFVFRVEATSNIASVECTANLGWVIEPALRPESKRKIEKQIDKALQEFSAKIL